MRNDMITFDELKNIRYLSAEEGNIVKAFSMDKGISLHVTFDKDTRMLTSITVNGTAIDITRENIAQLNAIYSGQEYHMEVTSSITIDEIKAPLITKIEGDTITGFGLSDNLDTIYIVYSDSTKVISSIEVNGKPMEVTRENIEAINKAFTNSGGPGEGSGPGSRSL